MKISALALILLSFQVSFSQQINKATPKQNVVQKAAADQKVQVAAKLKVIAQRQLVSHDPKASNDAGVTVNRVAPVTSRTQAVCQTYTGSLTAADLSMGSRLSRPGAPTGSCSAAYTTPVTIAGGPFAYDKYNYTNTSGLTQCGTITLTTNDVTNANIQFALYNNSFDPTNLITNYFMDPGLSSGTPAVAVTANVTVPSGANLVVVVYSTNPNTSAPGTASDYTLTISYPVCSSSPCTGTPAPGNTISTANPVCPGLTFTLSTQNAVAGSGVNHQWQKASAAAGPFTNIAGATGATFATTQTVATYYRDSVTCTATSLNAKSTALLVTVNPPSACYCTPVGDECDLLDAILNVTFGGKSNASGCSTTGYTNYTTANPPGVMSALKGVGNPISVTIDDGGEDFIAVWIDYNQNGTFEPSEFTLLGQIPVGTINGTINIPNTALTGVTRMRVKVDFFTQPTGGDACTTFGFAETEDYAVDIEPCIPGTYTTQSVGQSVQCGSDVTFNVAATGSALTYHWQYKATAGGIWQYIDNGSYPGVYTGATTNTLTIKSVTAPYSGYRYRAELQGPCMADNPSDSAILTVTPLIATVTPTSATICAGSIQALSITNTISAPVTATFNSGNVNIPIPDVNTTVGITNSMAVAAIPAGSLITDISIKLNITHTYIGDLVIALKAPNGKILNLDDLLGTTDNGLQNFTNTIISSNGVLLLKNWATNGFTATFAADNVFGPDGFGLPTGPNGLIPNTHLWSDFYGANSTNLNGNWTIGMYDAGTPDSGTLLNWSISITYVAPIFASGTWTSSPAAPNTMFTDPAATVAYTGTPVSTIYVKPAVNTNYSVVVSTPAPCTAAAVTIPVSVTNPVTNLAVPATKTACVGSSTSITATATGGPITWQWQVSADNGLTYSNVSNATSATLTLSGLTQIMNNYKYRVIATASPCGSVTSAVSQLTVNPLPTVVITPSTTSLLPAQTASITATSTPAAATYSWTFNGTTISGNATNTVSGISIDGFGAYQATVTDVNGCVNKSNIVTIGASPSARLWIYPNPTSTGRFQVRLYDAGAYTDTRVVTIYDAYGQRIKEQIYYTSPSVSSYQEMDFDLSSLSDGIYLVKVAGKFSGKIVSGFVVVHH